MAHIYVDINVKAVIGLYEGIIAEELPVYVASLLEAQASILHTAHGNRNLAAAIPISNWFPPLVGKEGSVILDAAFTIEDAQLTIAREHGYRDWESMRDMANQFDPLFEAAVDALVDGQLGTLNHLLAEQPSLATATSAYGHRATLLHYLAANGTEIRRQKVPSNAVDIARALLAAGASPRATASVYNGRYTALQLLVTGEHPRAAGIEAPLEALLRQADSGQ